MPTELPATVQPDGKWLDAVWELRTLSLPRQNRNGKRRSIRQTTVWQRGTSGQVDKEWDARSHPSITASAIQDFDPSIINLRRRVCFDNE